MLQLIFGILQYYSIGMESWSKCAVAPLFNELVEVEETMDNESDEEGEVEVYINLKMIVTVKKN